MKAWIKWPLLGLFLLLLGIIQFIPDGSPSGIDADTQPAATPSPRKSDNDRRGRLP